jgi:AmpD protein
LHYESFQIKFGVRLTYGQGYVNGGFNLQIDKMTGFLVSARTIPSTHYNERPENMPIDMIVIHNISLPPGEFGSGAIEKFFCDELDMTQHPYFSTIADLKVSSHLLIDRNGEITQCVPFSKRAWHAGQSQFQERMNCNDFSIGIELEGTDDLPFEKKQYETLAKVIQALLKTYPNITRERIVGHSDIAPGRKTDPGPFFDWNFLDCLL